MRSTRRAYLQGLLGSFTLPLLAGPGPAHGQAATPAQAKPQAKTQAPAPELIWTNVETFGIEGRAWSDQPRARYFDRFPAEAEKQIPAAVWSLSRDSAGMMVRFRTDASSIHARYRLRSERLAMPHMPATGVSGVDLYAQDEQGRWRWVAVSMPAARTVDAALVGGIPSKPREYLLYLPLYNGVDSLEIGVPPKASLQGHAPRSQPVVFYGTSITHGACASRPGMVHTAILGRKLDVPVVNLGFSGNGRMDPGVVDWLARVEAAAYVIDCLPNMDAAAVTARTAPLVKSLRAARPQTPIVLVEDRRNTNSWIHPSRTAHHDANHKALRAAFDQLTEQGVAGLFYLPGDALLGDDSEGATDGSHPNDLGFLRQAEAFEPVLRRALAWRPNRS